MMKREDAMKVAEQKLQEFEQKLLVVEDKTLLLEQRMAKILKILAPFKWLKRQISK